MADPLLVRPSALFAKTETTKGTAITSFSATTDGLFNVMNVSIKEDTGLTSRPAQAGFGKLRGVPEAMSGTATFEVNLEGGASGAVPAWASVFLPACGYVATSGVFTRTGDTTAQTTLTLVHYKGAGAVSIKQTLSGAMGSFKITYRNGRAHTVAFTFKGKYMSEATATLVVPTLPTTVPPRGFATLTVGSVNLLAPEVTYDAGQTVLLIEGPNDTSATGFVNAIVTDFNPTFTAEPYQESLAVADWRADFVAATERALSIVVGVANPITLASTAIQLTGGPGFGTREQAYTRQLTWADNSSAGASLTFA